MIDLRGVFLMTALASVVCAAALALQSGHRNLARPRYAWAAGYALLAAGWALMGLRYQIPMALSIVGSNVALFSGFVCTIVGLDGFVGRPIRGWIVPGTGLLVLVLFTGLLLIDPSGGNVRIAAAGLLGAAIAGYAAWIVRANRSQFSDGPGHVLVWTYVGIAVLSLGRVATAAFGTPHADFRTAAPSEAVAFSIYAVVTMVLAFAYMRLISLDVIARLERVAWHDTVSGAYTRSFFESHLRHEVERASRFDTPLALVLFDLDHFKVVNDSHGHVFGDHCLAAVANAVSTVVRSIDTIARFGGDEFGVILPGSDLEDAGRVAERLRQAVAKADVARQTGLTVSIGVAQYRQAEDAGAFLDRADRVLYEAKRTGRDRISIDNQYLSQNTTAVRGP